MCCIINFDISMFEGTKMLKLILCDIGCSVFEDVCMYSANITIRIDSKCILFLAPSFCVADNSALNNKHQLTHLTSSLNSS